MFWRSKSKPALESDATPSTSSSSSTTTTTTTTAAAESPLSSSSPSSPSSSNNTNPAQSLDSAATSASAVSSTSADEWTTKGPAGLGVISSLSEECTPPKHRYDSCFDKWFTDYLAIGDAQILEQQQQGQSGGESSASSPADSDVKKSGKGWFGSTSETPLNTSSSSGLFLTGGDPEVENKKKAIIERYESDCGQLFKEYQACVKRAVSQKGLDPLIESARIENPFPFDHERKGDKRENNPPFPFPAAKPT